ncbi:MAG: hypothetical protein GXX85_16330 [Ignavibacteria bacterium]|nr:hypothetical protein [Ignavibacteria bacterium]
MNKNYLFLMMFLFISISVIADPYDDYSDFAKENFGAEKEPLIYEKQGNNLIITEDGNWMYVSVYSAAIAWETNLPAETYIEFGITASYGLQTEVTDRCYYIHLHYLKNLSSNTLYHYRLVSKDERGNIIYSEDRTLTTGTLGSRIRIPEDFPAGTEKFDCNVANTTYLVTQDITANGRAIEINAANITIDLGGKTIIYNNAHVEVNDPIIILITI